VAHTAGAFRLVPGTPAAPATPIRLTDGANAIDIDTGKMQARIPKKGAAFLESITMEGRQVAGTARLTCSLEGGAAFTGQVNQVTVEQRGPVRATVKIDGVHKADSGSREWMPFSIRLYFYAGSENIRLIHSFIFDGDDKKDFIRSLGVAFAVPMREQIHNRHVRFSGADEGLWSEPVQPATGRRVLMLPGRAGNAFADQLAGKRLPNREAFDQAGQKLLHDWAVWSDYKLVQWCADGFSVQKRVNGESSWLDAAGGQRASGLVFAGGTAWRAPTR
jgi:hypothetical protein